jgi:hypothetical protein
MTEEPIDPTLIFNSLNFIQSITKNYGAEQGMAMWDTIVGTVDRRLKLEVFKAMIDGGQVEGRIRISGAQPSADKIKLIKTLREHTGYDLKEAKDSVDLLQHTNTAINIKVSYHNHHKAVKDLQLAGFIL